MSAEPELKELLAIALRAAEIARGVIMPIWQTTFSVELKADGTPVTAADRGAEEAIRAFLALECPGHGVLGEEFGETPGQGRYRWVLDPIDGTKAFVHHVPLFGSLIALERDGWPVVGVIACHAVGEIAAAAEGYGATVNGERARVSTVGRLEEAMVSTSSVAGLNHYQPDLVATLAGRAKLMRTWGDCYGYLMLAAGRADIMLDAQMSPWDVAALFPIIREAGGTITTFAGEGRPGDSVAASNGHLHGELLSILRGGGQEPDAS